MHSPLRVIIRVHLNLSFRSNISHQVSIRVLKQLSVYLLSSQLNNIILSVLLYLVAGAKLINTYSPSRSQKEKPIMRSLEISEDFKTR